MGKKGIITEKGVIILQLLANGHKQKEISNEIHLTTRGVDYHIEKAKNILNANTRCELIAKSYLAGLIHFEGNFYQH